MSDRYTDSLNSFEQASNETDQNVIVMVEILTQCLQRHTALQVAEQRPCRWLDVGAGDGEKIAKTLERLLESKVLGTTEPVKLKIEYFEANEDYRRTCQDRLQGVQARTKAIEAECLTSLQGTYDLMGSLGELAATREKFNLISLVHSLYQFDVIPHRLPWHSESLQVFENIRRVLRLDGMLLVITESPGSDFYIAKAPAYQKAGIRLINPSLIKKSVARHMISTVSEVTIGSTWKCRKSDLSDITCANFPAFLAYTRLDQSDEQTNTILAALQKRLLSLAEKRKNLQGQTIIEFSTPNCCLIFDLDIGSNVAA